VSLQAPPGAAWAYSNSNFNVLGLIVQTVVGQTYERYLAEQVLHPLDMRHSFVSPEEARAHGRATGHRYWFGHPRPYEMPYDRAQLPAGFLNASAEDLGHYLIAQLNDGRYGDRAVLSPAGIAALHQPAAAVGYGDLAYAMGWFVGPTAGIPTVSHGGSLASFHADLVLVPEGRWGIALLLNGEDGRGARVAHIATGVTSLLVGQSPPPIVAPHDSRSTFLTYVLVALALQALGISWSVTLLRRWRRDPARRPHGRARLALHLIPALVLNPLWALLCLIGMPLALATTRSDLHVFVPDLGYASLLSGTLALGWGLLQPVLMALVCRRPRPSTGAGVPTRG
jgi:CubicO group peptidase (beta-lactamase class C family)